MLRAGGHDIRNILPKPQLTSEVPRTIILSHDIDIAAVNEMLGWYTIR